MIAKWIAFGLLALSLFATWLAATAYLFDWQLPVPAWTIAIEAASTALVVLCGMGIYQLFFLQPTQTIAIGDAAALADAKRYDEHIKFEFELTAQRLTYLAISESFLFGTYATALSALSTNDLGQYASTLKRLVSAVPWIGLSLALAVSLAVFGAISMIFKLKEARSLKTGGELHHDAGWRSIEHFFGLLPPVVIPIAFAIAWLCVWPT